jgi:hypothetical protein
LPKVYFYVNGQANNGVGSMLGLTMKSLKHQVALQNITKYLFKVYFYANDQANNSVGNTQWLTLKSLKHHVALQNITKYLSKVYFDVNVQANNGVGSMQGLTMKSLKHHVALQPLFVIIGAGMVFVGAYVFRSATSCVAEPRIRNLLPLGAAGAEPKSRIAVPASAPFCLSKT